MSYIINKFDGTQLVVLEDGTLDTTTSVGLVGRNYIGYGETQNENFVYLLENFANSNPPSRPLEGQTWWNKAAKSLNAFNGTDWAPVGAAYVGSVPPAINEGQLWFKLSTNQLFIFSDEQWNLVGPEAVDGFGETKWNARILKDVDNINHSVLVQILDDEIVAISAKEDFTISPTNTINGFFNLKRGLNLKETIKLIGNVIGNSTTASSLEIARGINGVAFDGTANIEIKASTFNSLESGTYLNGSDFDGSSSVVWSVDATPGNVIGKIVARDGSGNFEAGTITADLVGNVEGNVVSTGTSNFNLINATVVNAPTLIGNSTTASKLQTARTINDVLFDGTSNITVTASANTLTGDMLPANVLQSSLTTVGVLSSLTVASSGIDIGTSSNFKISIDGAVPTLQINTESPLRVEIRDVSRPSGRTDLKFIPASTSLSLNGPSVPSLIPEQNGSVGAANLGHPQARWKTLYVDNIEGTVFADDLKGGLKGSIPYQAGTNDTAMLPIGSTGQILRAGASGLPEWSSASTGNVPNSVVLRDGSGNFNAATITATLAGNASTATLATAAVRLQTARRINGVLFDGTADINVSDTTPIWAGETSLGNVIATFSNNTAYPIGTKVAFLDTRYYNFFTGNGAVYVSDLYRRVVRKVNNFNGWVDVGG